MKLLWLDPNRAFKLTKPKTVDNLVKVVHPEYKGFFESFSIFSYKGACACWKLSCPKIENHVFYIMSHVYINRLSVRDYGDVWQFPMPYPFCVIQNDPVTYKMWSYVIYWLASPICTINTWTGKFSTQRWCIMFSKFQEFFNTILILFSYTWCFHPTSIHVSPLLSHFIKLSHMQENLTFSIKGVTLSHSRRHFIVDSYVKVNSVFQNGVLQAMLQYQKVENPWRGMWIQKTLQQQVVQRIMQFTYLKSYISSEVCMVFVGGVSLLDCVTDPMYLFISIDWDWEYSIMTIMHSSSIKLYLILQLHHEATFWFAWLR